MLQIACWFYFSDIKPTIIINQKVQIYQPLNSHIGLYEGHSVNSEIRYVSAIAYLLAESWCCLYKAPTFISHNTKETIS